MKTTFLIAFMAWLDVVQTKNNLSFLRHGSNRAHGRNLAIVEQTVQRIEYQGRIKHVLGFWCQGSLPVVHIGCNNGGHLQVNSYSDSRISCQSFDGDESNAYCTIDCQDKNECESIFITDDYEDDKWASIYFSCEGPTVATASATFTYMEGVGSCVASNSLYLDNFNYRIAELGPLCNNNAKNNGNSNSDNWEYNFEAHRFLECAGGPSVFTGPVAGDYACLMGQNCDFQFCNVAFDAIRVETVPSNLDEESCVQTLTRTTDDSSLIEEVLPAEPEPLPSGDYSTYYQALWSHVIEETFCEGDIPVVEIRCQGGELLLGNHLHGTVECVMLDDMRAECTDTCTTSCSHFVGQTTFSDGPQPRFSGVTFECHSTTSLEETRAELTYRESFTECGSYLTSFWTSYHFLELGVICGNDALANMRRASNDFAYSDNLVECGAGNRIGFDTGDSNDHYQCFAEAIYEGEESIANALLPAVSMISEGLREACYPESLPAPPTPSPTPAPTGASTAASTTASTASSGSTDPGASRFSSASSDEDPVIDSGSGTCSVFGRIPALVSVLVGLIVLIR